MNKYIEPIIELREFYYHCGKTFQIDRFDYLFKKNDGFIIFVNGEICYIYKFENKFIKIKSINANLISRHKKGGQSSLRFSRLIEESRQIYISRIVETINNLCKNNIYIFGSREIMKMIFERKDIYVKINNGGFLEFDENTINDYKYWYKFLDNKDIIDNKKYEEIILYLDTNVDMLDFDPNNKNEMKFYLTKDDIYNSNYERLKNFEYIGVKYYI